MKFCEGLLSHLGFNKDKFQYGNYEDVAKEYGVSTIEHTQEQKILKEKGTVFFLQNFPMRTDPFWNMKRHPDGKLAYKLDVIVNGMETIGSAERSTDPIQMVKDFYEISGGEYSKTLYEKLDKESVDRELQEYLSVPALKTTVRCGGGIGLTRLIKGMRENNLIDCNK